MILAETLAPSDAGTRSLRVLFFGKVADRFGRARDLQISAAGCTVATLRSQLAAIEGGAAILEPGVRAAIDHQIVLSDDALVRPGQEVAFFSAFSGG